MGKIVIINGSGTSGKDTVVELVKRNFGGITNVYNVSSIDKVREAAKLLGWKGDKSEDNREFLHRLKMLASEFYDHSTNYMVEKISTFENPYIAFFHIREPKEIENFKNILLSSPTKVYTALVKRYEAPKFANDADRNVEKYNYDFTIDNNGTLYDLECKVLRLFGNII